MLQESFINGSSFGRNRNRRSFLASKIDLGISSKSWTSMLAGSGGVSASAGSFQGRTQNYICNI
jgi:hypothetical protein